MAISIANLRFQPYQQKDAYKPIFGGTLDFDFILPTPHQTGDKYLLACDWEKVVYPPARPLCAYSEVYTLNETEEGSVLSMSLKFVTGRFRDYVCKLKKPMPITLQLIRIRGDRQETLLLDDILALPSIADGKNIVVEGDPLDERLDEKMDNPPTEGEAGQVLTINEDGQIVWADSQGGDQADWDESDSESPAYIKNKPDLGNFVEKEEGKGLSTNDFTDNDKNKLDGIEEGAQKNARIDWDESDSDDDAFIANKPQLARVALTGSYDDLTDKPTIPVQKNADWDESDSSDPAFIENKPTIPSTADIDALIADALTVHNN